MNIDVRIIDGHTITRQRDGSIDVTRHADHAHVRFEPDDGRTLSTRTALSMAQAELAKRDNT